MKYRYYLKADFCKISFYLIIFIFEAFSPAKTYSLSPLSQYKNTVNRQFEIDWDNVSPQYIKKRQLQNLEKAVVFFNKTILHSEKLTIALLVSLYEIIRGDFDNDQYLMSDERKKRIETLGNKNLTPWNWNSNRKQKVINIIEAANMTSSSKQEVIENAVSVFDFIVGNQLLSHHPGFSIHISNDEGTTAFDGHHRLAFFILNFILINNGIPPCYLNRIKRRVDYKERLRVNHILKELKAAKSV